jgi:hypothetical protein
LPAPAQARRRCHLFSCSPASPRPGHRPAEVLDDVEVDFRVGQAALPEGVEGVQHQGSHHEVGEEQLGRAGLHEFLAGQGGGIAVPGVGNLGMVAAERRGEIPAFPADVDLDVAVLVVVAPGNKAEVGQSGRVAADQVTGGVVVNHQEDHFTFADQTGHVVRGDVFGPGPEGEGLELPGQFPGLDLGLVAQAGKGLAGGVARFKPVAVDEGEPGRLMGILQVAAEKGQQGTTDAPDTDGFDF